jgi:polar amino acid transport system substrate-binding protein
MLALLMLTLLLALPLPLTKPAGAQDMATIQLVTGNAYHPYTDESLPQGGLASAIVARVFADMGFKAEFTFLPWDDGYAQARDGQFIATFPYIVTAARKQDFLYTTELFQVRPSLFWNVTRKLRVNRLSDLMGRSLCVPEGWAIDSYLATMTSGGGLSVVRGASIRDCFTRLHRGDVDVVSADRRLGQTLTKQIAPNRWSTNRRFVQDGVPNHLLFTKRHPQAAQWVKAFDAAFAELRDSGTLFSVIREYYEGS